MKRASETAAEEFETDISQRVVIPSDVPMEGTMDVEDVVLGELVRPDVSIVQSTRDFELVEHKVQMLVGESELGSASSSQVRDAFRPQLE